MKELNKMVVIAMLVLCLMMTGTGFTYKSINLAKSVESFPDHSRIPNTNPKSKL